MSQIVPAKDAMREVSALLASDKVKTQLAAALPRVGITPERMVRFALTALNRAPALLKCEQRSLLACIVQSAQLGLDPSGITGEAYLVPYGNTATFIIGWRGFLKLARRSGKVTEAAAHVVYEGDAFEFEYGLDSRLVHRPTAKDRGDDKITHAYAYAKLDGGGRVFEVLTRDELEKVRSSSRASRNGPWVTHFPEMCRKSAFRRLAKWLPLEPEDFRAVELAAREESGLPQNIADVLDDGPAGAKPTEATVTETAPPEPNPTFGGDDDSDLNKPPF